MKVLMFKPQFAPLVKAGTKRQTIRPKRKHPIKPDDELSLREWTGKPYRSKQQILRDGVICKNVKDVQIVPRSTPDGMFVSCFVAGERMESLLGGSGSWDRFAEADGFKNAAEMLDWFRSTHGLPFNGDLIQW